MGNTQAQAGGARLISRSTIEVIQSRKDEIIAKWMAAQRSGLAHRQSLLSPQELLITTNEFFAVFVDALQNADLGVLADPSWAPVKEVLDRMSRARAEQGLTPSETSTMILALKETLSDILQEYFHSEPAALVGQLSGLSRLLDALALYTTEVFVKSRRTSSGNSPGICSRYPVPVSVSGKASSPSRSSASWIHAGLSRSWRLCCKWSSRLGARWLSWISPACPP